MTTSSVRISRRSDTGSHRAAGAPDPFAAVPCPVIAAAARHTLEAFRNEAGDAVSPGEAGDVLASLAMAVARVASGKGGVEQDDRRTPPVLGQRLLELLRDGVVGEWSRQAERPTPDEILATLRAFEQVRRCIEPSWSEHFASRLSGPDALDLVVEVAHDLRSPLTSILFLAETLQRGQSGEVNDLQHRQLGLVYGAALGLSSVTSDVIELARGGDRLVDKNPAPFSVAEILESVRDIVHPIAEEKGLEVRISPPASDHRLGHPLALSRVLLNLTTNALKFTDEGQVLIEAKQTGIQQVEFSVRDTGRGISADALESLYQPFRRTAARKGYCFSGTGLGLSICAKLVEAMGSRLEVETRASWGTRFHFQIELPPASHI